MTIGFGFILLLIVVTVELQISRHVSYGHLLDLFARNYPIVRRATAARELRNDKEAAQCMLERERCSVEFSGVAICRQARHSTLEQTNELMTMSAVARIGHYTQLETTQRTTRNGVSGGKNQTSTSRRRR